MIPTPSMFICTIEVPLVFSWYNSDFILLCILLGSVTAKNLVLIFLSKERLEICCMSITFKKMSVTEDCQNHLNKRKIWLFLKNVVKYFTF